MELLDFCPLETWKSLEQLATRIPTLSMEKALAISRLIQEQVEKIGEH